MTRVPRILVINPNTTRSVTDLVMRHVEVVAGGRVELVSATAAFGCAYISSEVAYAVASHAAVDCLRREGAGCDGVLLACFGDPGLHALREMCEVPVAGLAEASILRSVRHAGRFSIVTGGATWERMLSRLVAGLGLQQGLASIRTLPLTGGDIASDPNAALDALAAACALAASADGAQEVILGGAGLAGLANSIGSRCSVPVVDSVVAATQELLARIGIVAAPDRELAPLAEAP